MKKYITRLKKKSLKSNLENIISIVLIFIFLVHIKAFYLMGKELGAAVVKGIASVIRSF